MIEENGWRKANASADSDSCVWVKAVDSGGHDGGDCVWVAKVTEPESKAGYFTLEAKSGHRRIIRLEPDTAVLIKDEHGNVCQYTQQEWDMFERAARAGEFSNLREEPGVHATGFCAHVPFGGNHPLTAG